MPARDVRRTVRRKPAKDTPSRGVANGGAAARDGTGERYRRLPTGTHGLDPEEVRRDQRKRLCPARRLAEKENDFGHAVWLELNTRL